MGLVHGPNERVVFLDGAESLVPIDPVRLNAAYNYKAVTVNQDVADAVATLFTWRGGTVRPLSPVNVRGHRDSEGNLLIEWTRRSRMGQGLKPFSDVPLGEERELYEVDILDGSNNVLRTLRVDLLQGVPAVLIGTVHPEQVIGNSISGESVAYTLQKLDKPGAFIEARLSTTAFANMGLIESHYGPQAGYAGLGESSSYKSILTFAPTGVTPGLSIAENASNDAPPSTVKFESGSLGAVTAVRIRIEIGDSGAKYYWDYTGPGSVPFYVSDYDTALPVVGYLTIVNSGTIDDVFVGAGSTPSTILSVDDQIELFGSPQIAVGSVRVDVYQISSIVGRGARARANL